MGLVIVILDYVIAIAIVILAIVIVIVIVIIEYNMTINDDESSHKLSILFNKNTWKSYDF